MLVRLVGAFGESFVITHNWTAGLIFQSAVRRSKDVLGKEANRATLLSERLTPKPASQADGKTRHRQRKRTKVDRPLPLGPIRAE